MNKKIYRINDNLSFRKCDLFYDEEHLTRGDCTSCDRNGRFFNCRQSGIHFHCTAHPEIELDTYGKTYDTELFCPKCDENKFRGNITDLIERTLRIAQREDFKDADLIRVDDWYFPEIKKKVDLGKESDYWMEVSVKKDKDGQTIVVVYVGNRNNKEKSQFFIKPEKLQLSSDHKDLDPATILTKIEVYLKDRKIIQEYDKD